MEVRKIPSATPDPLAERHARVQAGLSGKPDPPKSAAVRDPAPVLGPTPRVTPKDSLELFGQLVDQHAIVGKRIREIAARPIDSRQESLRVVGTQLFKMMETVKEMGGK